MTKLTDQIKQSADQAWESLTEGWRELGARASGALTRFLPIPTDMPTGIGSASPYFSAAAAAGLDLHGGRRVRLS